MTELLDFSWVDLFRLRGKEEGRERSRDCSVIPRPIFLPLFNFTTSDKTVGILDLRSEIETGGGWGVKEGREEGSNVKM